MKFILPADLDYLNLWLRKKKVILSRLEARILMTPNRASSLYTRDNVIQKSYCRNDGNFAWPWQCSVIREANSALIRGYLLSHVTFLWLIEVIRNSVNDSSCKFHTRCVRDKSVDKSGLLRSLRYTEQARLYARDYISAMKIIQPFRGAIPSWFDLQMRILGRFRSLHLPICLA